MRVLTSIRCGGGLALPYCTSCGSEHAGPGVVCSSCQAAGAVASVSRATGQTGVMWAAIVAAGLLFAGYVVFDMTRAAPSATTPSQAPQVGLPAPAPAPEALPSADEVDLAVSDFWTVVAASIPVDSANAEGGAQDAVDKLQQRGLSTAAWAPSEQWTSLKPGYLVVYAGEYGSLQQAQQIVGKVKAAGFSGAYTRHFEGSAGASVATPKSGTSGGAGGSSPGLGRLPSPSESAAGSKCYACRGTGVSKCGSCDGRGTTKCYSCRGTGRVKCYLCDGDGRSSSGGQCLACLGEGYNECGSCDGTGGRSCMACDATGVNACMTCDGTGQL